MGAYRDLRELLLDGSKPQNSTVKDAILLARLLNRDGSKDKKKKEEKKEWKWEERICLGLIMTIIGPVVGMACLNILVHVWANTLDTLKNVH